MMRVLALAPVPRKGASTRFRVAQYIPYLESQGISLTIAPFFTEEFFDLAYRRGHHGRKALLFLQRTIARVVTLFHRHQYDVMFISREAFPIGPAVFEAALAASGVPLVYDFDDAVFLENVPENTSDANRYLAALKYPGKIASIIRRSDQVIAGNEYLAAYARRFNPSVHVIPTSVDVDAFVPRSDAPPADAPPVVGWIGTPTTATYVRELGPILQTLAGEGRFVFRVAGAAGSVNVPGVPTENLPWSLDREVELFNTCDIGVYPLKDDEWSKGKCGFKAIQFMACGVPVVAAAVGVNREIIEDGVNGFLASTPSEWEQKLRRLLADPELRRRLGAAGRRTITERYSMQVNAARVAGVIRQAAARLGSAVPLAHVSGGPR